MINAIIAEQHFSSWYEYVNHVEKADYTHGTSRTLDEDKWNGTRTWEQAVDLAHKGWPKLGVKSISDNLFVNLSRYCLRPEPRYVMEGHTLDIGRWIEGEPEHWLVMDESETTSMGKKVCKIVYNQTASGGISTAVMQAKGATIAALIRLLDYCDIRTELELIGVISETWDREKSNRVAYYIQVKDAAQDLDFDIISFAIGHPASFRRLGFACLESFSQEIVEKFQFVTGGSYSYPSDLTTKEQNACDVYIGSQMLGEPEWTDTQACQKWVLEQLVKQGVSLKEQV